MPSTQPDILTQPDYIFFAIHKMLPSNLSLTTQYGELYLDHEAELAVQKALTDLYQKRAERLLKNDR